jgi:Protein of unknown function (DUF3800)
MPCHKRRQEFLYRLFADEVGHHNMKSAQDPNEQYLGLTGVIFDREYASTIFTAMLDKLKSDSFGTIEVVLHRREILNRKPAPFDQLADEPKRCQFDGRLLQLVESAEYTAITVVIDKKEHAERYSVWQFQPYHYCLTTMLERYVLWLRGKGQVGDVMIESRGKADNIKLERAYKHIYEHGTENVSHVMMQKFLSSKEIKLKPKTANIAGLQLADLLANPAWRDLICRQRNEPMKAGFGHRIVEILYASKYRRRHDGKIEGWGTKMLP